MVTIHTRIAAAVFVTALSLLVVGCQHSGPDAAAAHRSASDTARDSDAGQLLSDATEAVRATQSAHVLFSSTNIADLLARTYAADITLTPANAARGNGTLKINGTYSQAEFRTNNGVLWVEAADGAFVNTGPAHGTLDPAALLDPERGIAALLAAVTGPVVQERESHAGNQAAVKIAGTLLPSAAGVLVPVSTLRGASQLPVMLWVTPQSPRKLVQVIITINDGSLTLQLGEAAPFTTPPK